MVGWKITIGYYWNWKSACDGPAGGCMSSFFEIIDFNEWRMLEHSWVSFDLVCRKKVNSFTHSPHPHFMDPPSWAIPRGIQRAMPIENAWKLAWQSGRQAGVGVNNFILMPIITVSPSAHQASCRSSICPPTPVHLRERYPSVDFNYYAARSLHDLGIVPYI